MQKSIEKKEFKVVFLKDMQETANEILDLMEDRNLLLLEGELGAGKTTLTQKILKKVGAKGSFTSPTFVVLKDYKLQSKSNFKKAFHFDCYRISSADLAQIGWQEIIENKNNLVIVEWPKRIKEALPNEYLHVRIEVIDENKRRFFIKSN